MRRLTLEEAELVSNRSLPNGDRPTFFNANTQATQEIGVEFESYLIVTPIDTRSDVSTFLQTIQDNDPNQIELRNQLLFEFLDEEMSDEIQKQGNLDDLTSYYDRVRSTFSSSLEGFEDIDEASLLQEALTASMGDIVSARDRHKLNYAVLSVLRSRLDNGRSQTLSQEIRAWIRLLVEYE